MKNIIRSIWLKGIVFVLAAGFLTYSILQMQSFLYYGLSPQLLWTQSYQESIFEEDLDGALQSIYYYLETKDLESLPANAAFVYRIEEGEQVRTNHPEIGVAYFESLTGGYYLLVDDMWQAKGQAMDIANIRYPSQSFKGQVYVGFPDDFFQEQEETFLNGKALATDLFARAALGLGLFMICFLYLFSVSGKRANSKEIHLAFLDKIHSDLLLIPFVVNGFFWLVTMDALQTYGYTELILSSRQKTNLVLVGVITFFTAVIMGTILLSWIRKGKKGTLLKHSLIHQVFYGLWRFFTGFLDGRRFEKYSLTKSLYYRQWIFIVGSFLLVFLFLISWSSVPSLPLFPLIMEGVLIYFYVKYNNKTYEAINLGINESLEEQMKAERMKVALVTNVSHDLKTPLTSIISYTDLLSKEEGLSENAREYIQILSEKSDRLKRIVADLFDLAKSTTGNIQIQQEPLDLKTLLQQTLADMDDEIQGSGLVLRTNLPTEGVQIFSDGNKLYRVFQNLMDNALKYGMPGTRIFLDLTKEQGKAVLTLKNTAGYEMNFTEEEILQRFTRGDESRGTEGSGLGLSIAESFTRVSGGDFQLKIDGDQFHIRLTFPLYQSTQ